MASHQKVMDTQFAQIAQQVSSLSRPQKQLPGQSEVNPRGHINAVYQRNERVMESPITVVQEVAPVPISTGTTTLKNEGALNQEDEDHQPPPVRPYQPPVPYPQRLVRAKLSQLEPRFI